MMARSRRRFARPSEVAPPEETAVLYEEEVGPPAPPIEPPPEALLRERELWPWMLVLLALVLAGLAAAYFATRDDKKNATSGSTTVTTTLAQTVVPTPTGPAPATRVAVPRLVGMPAPAALEALQQLGLTGDVRGAFSTRPRNQVISQEPGAGTQLTKGAAVVVQVSKGAQAVPVPDVVGQEERAAIGILRAQRLETHVVRVPSSEPIGQVVAQNPAAGKRAQPGSTAVRLNVSSGEKTTTTTTTATTTAAPATVTVPNVIGKKLLAARRLIRTAGLVTEVKRVPNKLPKGTVVSQSPRPGTTAKRDDHVLVNVSLGPPPEANTPSTVPDVVGEDEETAKEDLKNAGFKTKVVIQETTDPAEDGIVIDQDPVAGEAVPAKTKVTIYVGRYSG